MNVFVTTGANAHSFYDPTTGISVVKGQEVELNENQYKAPKIQMALNSGHLVRVNKEIKEEAKQYSDSEVEKALKKLAKMSKDGATKEKMASNFEHSLILLMAEKSNVTVEDGDTDTDLIEAILTD